ncbi:MAG: hypothetical protein Q4B26_02330 [Eubacteriales bacterium]|nr:hypothetical protein [Eubacteriales bacterium]
MSKEKKESKITQERREEVLRALERGRQFSGKNYPKEVEEAIVYACNCDDEELKEKAITFVLVTNEMLFTFWIREYGIRLSKRAVSHKDDDAEKDAKADDEESIEASFRKAYNIGKISKPGGNIEYEDFISEIYIMLDSMLPKWNPSRGKLSTLLKGPFHEVVQHVLADSGLPSSKYGNKQENAIRKAVATLTARGVKAPTTKQIQSELLRTATSKAFIPSTDTIKKTIELVARKEEIENEKAGATAPDPLQSVMNQDMAIQIERAIDSLPGISAVIMRQYYKAMKSDVYDDGPSNTELINMVKQQIPGITKDQFDKSYKTACCHFRQAMKRRAIYEKSEFRNNRVHRNFSSDYAWKGLQEASETIKSIGTEEFFSYVRKKYADDLEQMMQEELNGEE